jgi:general secretion pathway protein E
MAATQGVEFGFAKLKALYPSTRLSSGSYADEIANFFRLSRISLREAFDLEPLSHLFSRKFLRENMMFAGVDRKSAEQFLIVADPTDLSAQQAAELVLRSPVTVSIASFDDITAILASTEKFEQESTPHQNRSPAVDNLDDIDNLRDLASGAPVVDALNEIFERAIDLRATDIHVEPFRSECAFRLRVDGLMRTIKSRADIPAAALISRIKILAGLDIAERRLPQDGAAHLSVANTSIDFRVATMPTKFGEAAVIRLLPKDRGLLDFEKLGLGRADHDRLRHLLELPHGLIVVTGPTGSGKTTTLATMISSLNDGSRKILTIEDPIEYEIIGVNQSQVKPEIGLTFATALRSFVRQDPDVIMVGEIRDSETARIAVHAALTGHLVLSTLHTESAAAAIPRMIDLGVEPFLLRSTLRGILAQRLVRQLCHNCKRQTRLSKQAFSATSPEALLGFRAHDPVYEPVGCEHCAGTGFRGRTGLFEIICAEPSIRDLIDRDCDATAIAQAAKAMGVSFLADHGAIKCREGMTAVQEVLRVVTIG